MKNKICFLSILILALFICMTPNTAIRLQIPNTEKTSEYLIITSNVEDVSHTFYKTNGYTNINNGYSHIINKTVTPFVIAGKNNEWIYINVITKTLGNKSRNVYITLRCEDELIDDWESNNPINPGKTGIHTYGFSLWKDFNKNNLEFKAETGHLEGNQRIKDDEKNFSIKIGKTRAIIDQMSTRVSTNTYVEMVKKISPFYQEITVGKSGQLHSIDVKPPLSMIDYYTCGCGPECEMNILVVEWFENWTNTPWNKNNFTILGETTVFWNCSEYPLPTWKEVYFGNQNIYLNKGEKIILMFEGKTFTDSCGNDGELCLGFSVGPANNYPNGLVGFWNGEKWMTWPTKSWDHLFRIWFKQGETVKPIVSTLNSSYDKTSSSIELYGKILDDGGEHCQIRFRYKTIDDNTWIYLSDWHGSYQTGEIFSEKIENLDKGKTYEFQAGAKNSAGKNWGETLRIHRNPEKPYTPSGPANGRTGKNYKFTTKAFDPDNDQIYLKFNWGDDTNSEWIGPYASGEEITLSHTWKEKGEYTIKVKAKDIYGYESEWSDPAVISIPKNKPTIRNLLFSRMIFSYFKQIYY